MVCRLASASSPPQRTAPRRSGELPDGRTRQPALRISAGSEAGEERPVGLADVEERAVAVVREASQSEGGAFDSLIRLLTASVGPLETRARCQLPMGVCQRARVRPRRRSSGGQSASCRSAASSSAIVSAQLGVSVCSSWCRLIRKVAAHMQYLAIVRAP